MASASDNLGRRGERAVAAWLASRGWDIFERRWRGASGELDLVCRDPDGWLVGVEVKVRSTGRAGSGAESLTARRVRRLRRSIAEYAVAHHAAWDGTRLDLVEVTAAGPGRWRLRHLPGIGGW